MCSGPQDVACAKEACFLLRRLLGTEAGLGRRAIMGDTSGEELFLLSDVKWHCLRGQSQAFVSEEVDYPKYEILQYVNKLIYICMLIFIT